MVDEASYRNTRSICILRFSHWWRSSNTSNKFSIEKLTKEDLWSERLVGEGTEEFEAIILIFLTIVFREPGATIAVKFEANEITGKRVFETSVLLSL